ncbi:HEXXH motif domain-containing protein [Actinomadura craniellae]|uniref:HEXXH motif domain-containing protein n=1 Tax=Actinomadura craniellae TaxID=2231787 RepID=A0A365H147_9ACTN|nr:HEXXH motif domain-containing protein [Actinomadura craniellae]RAY12812.1 HEXXH motif domain-containing protein [Actinomadura craniellae]
MSAVPEELFLALAAGGGGPAAAGQLVAAQAGKRLLLLRGVPETAGSAGHPRAAWAERAFTTLAELQEKAPDTVEKVVRYPTVGAWARRTLLVLMGRARGAADPGELAALPAAAMIAAGLPGEIEVPVRDGAVVLPALGRALVPGGKTALVRSDGTAAEVVAAGTRVRVPADPSHDAPGWEALRPLRAVHEGFEIGFLIDDHDPDRMPGAAVTGCRLAGPEVERWRASLTEAWEILVAHHRTTVAEVAALITVLTPLVAAPGRQASGTPRHAFGNIGLSAPHDPLWFAETLAHEVQHTKLTALLDLVPLTLPEDGSRYYAPWREDPRPAAGLLQGVYAHLGVTGFWRTQREHEAGERALAAHGHFARWQEATHQAARTLAGSGRLTPAGRSFVAETERTLCAWSREPVPAAALRRAQDAADRHRAEWRLRNED